MNKMEKCEKKLVLTDDELEILRLALVSRSCLLEKDIKIFGDDIDGDCVYLYQRSVAELDAVNDLMLKIFRLLK